MTLRVTLTAALLSGAAFHAPLHADAQLDAAGRLFADTQVRDWLSDPIVIDALRAQNRAHAGVDQAEIERLDRQWREESVLGAGELIDHVLASDLSRFLAERKAASGGLITEVFVMDNVGLNVGQSDVTSDYWQGDEAKWQLTYLAGPEALFVDEVEFDESSQRFQTQISLTIADPDSGESIGAVTVGVDFDALMMQ